MADTQGKLRTPNSIAGNTAERQCGADFTASFAWQAEGFQGDDKRPGYDGFVKILEQGRLVTLPAFQVQVKSKASLLPKEGYVSYGVEEKDLAEWSLDPTPTFLVVYHVLRLDPDRYTVRGFG